MTLSKAYQPIHSFPGATADAMTPLEFRADLALLTLPFSMFVGTERADPAVSERIELFISALDKDKGAVICVPWHLHLGVDPDEYRAVVESFLRKNKKLKKHVVDGLVVKSRDPRLQSWLFVTACVPGQEPDPSAFDTVVDLAQTDGPGNSIISFFTGAGFLDLGFEEAGFRIDMVNEYEREFLGGYRFARSLRGSAPPRYGYHLGSAEELSQGEHLGRLVKIVEDVKSHGRKVGFVGGPPCPDFSIGGKQAGSEGDNGRLTDVYFDAIVGAKPDFFIFENVEGLWKTKRHRKFYDEMKERAQAAGYVLHDRLINAVEYGVGQSRPRIFLVGVLGGDPDVVFPWEDNMTHSKSVLDLEWPQTAPFSENSATPFPADLGIPQELTVEHWFRRNDVSNHPNAAMSFVPKSARISEVPEGMTDHKSFKRLHRWRYSPTACYGNNEVHLHPYLPRRLSVAEALALQSMPSDFSLPTDMPLSKAFKTIGNGVPFLAALGLARSVRAVLDGAVPMAVQEAA
jgi:DNA (cytosine-5)-methyltransferase 1